MNKFVVLNGSNQEALKEVESFVNKVESFLKDYIKCYDTCSDGCLDALHERAEKLLKELQ